MKKLLLVSMCLLAVACSMKSDDEAVNAQDRKDQEQNEKLVADYQEVEGLYRGFISAVDREMPVELRLLTEYEESGKSSSGKTKTTPILRAALTLLDTTDLDYSFAVSFERSNGELIFSTTPQQKVISIPARLEGTKIFGEVRKDTSPLGPIKLELISKKFQNPTDIEVRARLISILKPAEGSFRGVFNLPSSKESVDLNIGINEAGRPSLIATCGFTVYAPEVMNATFIPHPSPPTLNLNLPSSTAIGCPFQTATGQLIGNRYEATTVDRRGVSRKIIFTKK